MKAKWSTYEWATEAAYEWAMAEHKQWELDDEKFTELMKLYKGKEDYWGIWDEHQLREKHWKPTTEELRKDQEYKEEAKQLKLSDMPRVQRTAYSKDGTAETKMQCRESPGLVASKDFRDGRLSYRPLPCNNRNCKPCRDSERKQIAAAYIDTAMLRHIEGKPALLTLTLMAGRKQYESWRQTEKLRGLSMRQIGLEVKMLQNQLFHEAPKVTTLEATQTVTAKIPGWLHDPTLEVEFTQPRERKWDAKKRADIATAILQIMVLKHGGDITHGNRRWGWMHDGSQKSKDVIALSMRALAPELMRDWLGGAWSEFWRRMDKKLGRPISALGCTEFTKQGIPHKHGCVMLHAHEQARFARIAKEEWQQISQGADQVDVSFGNYHRGKNVPTLQMKIWYVLKYIYKPEGRENDPWRNISYRRYSARNWERPDKSTASALRYKAHPKAKAEIHIRKEYKQLRNTMRARVLNGTLHLWDKLNDFRRALFRHNNTLIRHDFVHRRQQGNAKWGEPLETQYVTQWRDGFEQVAATGFMMLTQQIEHNASTHRLARVAG